MLPPVHIVWFKRDLRVDDHAPLCHAVAQGRVIPIYIVEPEYWALPDVSRRHWHFIHDSLGDLERALGSMGASLVIRTGDAVAVLEAIRATYGHVSLWSHEETGNGWTYARDRKVAAWCRSHGIKWGETPSNGIVRRLKSRDGWAALRDARMAQPILAAPPAIQPVEGVKSEPLPPKGSPVFGSTRIGNVQTGGRAEGLRTLGTFLDDRSAHYMRTISKPGSSARHCSRLSAHLAYGTLSVREVEQATQARMDALADIGSDEAKNWRRYLAAFRSRLAWHCHFIQKLEQQPSIEFQCMHPAFEGMREPHHRDDFFEAWKTGHTGYPLVDACMRSLHENGWITFRMRAMLVSFASYHLWLDWRRTAPFMAQLFTDYEPGIHYAQFQMQSGVTGINAVRMYNPIKQSIDHDPQGKFIRRYVPELAHVPDSFIHEPWRMDVPVPAYPAPMVDHETVIRHARAEIAARVKGPGFKEASRSVNQRLGSRNKQPTRRNKPKPKPSRQLTLEF
jgi:deoxyribodipyrimidine photo-lyase